MTRRNDAKPEIPDDTPHRERPQRPDPSVMKPEVPGDRDEERAEEDARNEATRRGES